MTINTKLAHDTRAASYHVMMKVVNFLVVLHLYLVNAVRYEPSWSSLDTRPLPSWYDESKIGIFIHWGVFSVPAVKTAWFWYYWKTFKDPEILKYLKENYREDFTYADFAPEFRATFFNPDEWADLFEASGAK
jgi:alpha-L-fucosidase